VEVWGTTTAETAGCESSVFCCLNLAFLALLFKFFFCFLVNCFSGSGDAAAESAGGTDSEERLAFCGSSTETTDTDAWSGCFAVEVDGRERSDAASFRKGSFSLGDAGRAIEAAIEPIWCDDGDGEDGRFWVGRLGGEL
jgi:hypothetical protein